MLSRIPLGGWVAIAVAGLILLAVILYFFTIEEIEFGVPPKIKFKRKTDKPDSGNQPVQTAHSTVTQTASGGGVNIGDRSVGPTFTGVIHGDVIIGAPTGHEPDIPKPPTQPERLQPNLVHPYPLQANFTGRLKERAELTAWLADDERPIYELVAMGGMGKSALTWVWLTQNVLKSPNELDGVMWWSFYEGESSFAKFVDEALKYVGDKPIDAKLFPTTYDRAQELRKQLQKKRVLFVLDGFERQLRAYASLDAAYKSQNAKQSKDARSCVDPITSRLLRDIAAITTRAKVLLTSRLPVSDLQDSAGDPLAGVVERDLKELAADDAITFMRAQRVEKGTDAEIAAVCADSVRGSRNLRLLSGLIAHDVKMPGDIAAAPRHDVFGDLVQRQHHVLEQSYDALPKRERGLLSRISAFRGPMSYSALATFNTLGSDQRFEDALEDLRVRGLLQRDFASGRYDLHPIVRHYAYERIVDKQGVHARLRDYFKTFPVPDPEQIRVVEDLAPAIELYHHTLRAGDYDDALDLFHSKISDSLYFSFGAYQTCIELLSALFPEGEDKPPRLATDGDQAWATNDLALSYAKTGQPRRALTLFQISNQIYEQRSITHSALAIGLGNLASRHTELGQLASSYKTLQRRIELCRAEKDRHSEAVGHLELGRLLTYFGRLDEAGVELDVAQQIFDEYGSDSSFGSVVRAERSLHAMKVNDFAGAITLATEARRRANEFADKHLVIERDIIRAQFFEAKALLTQGTDVSIVEQHLADSLTRCRRTNLIEMEPSILLECARLHWSNNNAPEARAFAHEAIIIADRCEYRLYQADIHNFLAQLALDAGDRDTARKEAELAKERAWCDGPPYCYKPALDEAERMLNELAAS